MTCRPPELRPYDRLTATFDTPRSLPWRWWKGLPAWLGVLGVCLMAGVASAQDTQPPTLSATPVLTPDTVDVSEGTQSVMVTLSLQDDDSGVRNANGQLVSEGGGFAGFFVATLASGTPQSGTWEATFSVGPNVASGAYDLRLTVIDEAFNFVELETDVQLVVVGGDATDPTLVGAPTITPTSIPLTEGPQTVVVEVEAADEGSGVEQVQVYFANADGGAIVFGTASLISGDAQQGTWRAEVEIDPAFVNAVLPEGNLFLFLLISDGAGNITQVESGLELVLVREQAQVTFQVDMRMMERLGLFVRGDFFAPRMKAFVEVFDGPEAGAYELSDFLEGDSIWTAQVLMSFDQEANYAFVVDPDGDGTDTGEWVYELDGDEGSRTVSVAQQAIAVPVALFDDRPLEPVDPGFAARVTSSFRAGASDPIPFDEEANETLVALGFSALSDPALVSVRRYSADPGGAPPNGIAVVAPGQFWGIEATPSSLSFDATLSIRFDGLSGIAAPEDLRLLRRETAGQPWTVVPTSLDSEAGTLSAFGLNGFSEWTIGSTSNANPLEPRPPGPLSSPVPADGEVRVPTGPELSWQPADFALAYDLYLWPASEPEATFPTAQNLSSPAFGLPTRFLQRNTEYAWYVVASNLDGETRGPTWTFTTEVLPDLQVSDFIAPSTAFSGQELEVQWTVTNAGEVGTDVPSWIDVVRISADPFFAGEVRSVGFAENPSALQPGEQYVQTATVRLPVDQEGPLYLQVEVNDGLRQGEIDASNNTATTPIEVTLTPAPDLQVTELIGPLNAFSGQAIELQWTVTNSGPGTASAPYGWVDEVFLSPTSDFDPQTATLLGSATRTGAVPPDSAYAASAGVVLPEEVSGPHFFFVKTDATGSVFEHLDEENNLSVAEEVTLTLSPPPDLAVVEVIVPETVRAGTTLSLTWRVQNQGPGSVTGRAWQDRVYLAKGSSFDPATARVLTTVSRFGTLRPDSLYRGRAKVTIPDGLEGPHQVVIQTDRNNSVFEHTFEENNTASAPVTLERPPYPELVVTSLDAPGAARAGELLTVRWTVRNEGETDAPPPWQDRLYLSDREAWDSTAVVLTTVPRRDTLNVSAAYSRAIEVRIPADREGTMYLHLVSDAESALYEYPDDTGNNVRSRAIDVDAALPSDLSATVVSSPAEGRSGEQDRVGWTVTNEGEGASSVRVWEDVVLLSTDLRADLQKDVVLARVERAQGLAPGETYTREVDVVWPEGVSGSFFVLVQSDAAGRVGEAEKSNNTTSAPIALSLSPASDLTPLIFDAPAEGRAGQPISVGWTVRNEGEGAAEAGWNDVVYLSRDKSIGLLDVKLGVVGRDEPLSIGAEYREDLEVALPFFATGTYYLLLSLDDGDTVFEGRPDPNNVVVQQIAVTLPPPSDLVVTDVTVPDLASPGEEVTVSWNVENRGAHPARGVLRDAVYVSADTAWTVEDPLLGSQIRLVDLAPGASVAMAKTVNLAESYLADHEGNVTGELPGVPPGAYHAIVRVDIQNNIRESDNENNAAASPGVMTTEVPELALGGSVAGMLAPGDSRYYRVAVPMGVETFQVTLTSDAPAAANELYIRAGAVPTRAVADVRFREPFAANQTLLVPVPNTSTDRVYYVLLYGREGPEAGLSYTLSAEEIDFELREIDLNQGGQGGAVTVRMDGSAIGPRLRAVLEMGDDRIIARDVYWVDGVHAYATFDLSQAALGTYDFVLERDESFLAPDLEGPEPVLAEKHVLRSALPGAFRVVQPQNVAPKVEVVVPEALRTEQEFTVALEVVNSGTNDLVSPLVLVWTEPATRSTLHLGEDVTEGARRILLAGSGPLAGILRPGATHRVVLAAEGPVDPVLMDLHAVPLVGSGVPFNLEAELRHALLVGDGLDWGGAVDRLRAELAGKGWADYQRRLARTASRLGQQGRRQTDGARLLLAHVRDLWQDELAPPYDPGGYIRPDSLAGVAKTAPTLPNPCDLCPSPEPGADCSVTTVACQRACMEGIALGFEHPDICDAPNGGAHLRYFARGETPDGSGLVVYGNDSDVAAKIRQVQWTDGPSYAEVHNAASTALKLELEQKILEAGCEGPSLVDYPDSELGDLGIQVMKPDFYPHGAPSSIPWNDPTDSREEELGLGLRSPQCDLVTAFGGMQSAKARASNMKSRMLPDPASNECYKGCTVLYQATIEYEFDDEYGFNKNDTGAYDILAKNLIECGHASNFDTKVKMQEVVSGIVRIPLRRRDCERPPPPDLPIIPPGPPIEQIPVITSRDPNDIVGPRGSGDEKWVAVSARLPYKIRFENDPRLATAPAQVVTIEQTLDSTLDARSFRLGPFGFGDFRFEPPENTAAYVERLDLTDSLGVFVDVNAGIDIETNRVFWTLRSIDPATSRAPANPFAGFLPVNDSLGSGEGFVDYTIRPAARSRTGDRATARARIVFDSNEAIDTPEIFNTIDAGLPDSRMSPLPFKADTTVVELSWTAEDDAGGSGLARYDVYLSIDDGPYEIYRSDLTDTRLLFNAEIDHQYRFFTLATDHAGNREPFKTGPDAAVLVALETQRDIPTTFALEQNYPNPFNPVTTVPYALPQSGEVELSVFNVLGQRVLRYRLGTQAAGHYRQRMDLRGLASGVYFYELRIRDGHRVVFRDVKKLVFIK